MYRNARDEPVDGANIGKVLQKLGQFVLEKDIHDFEEAKKMVCKTQKEYNIIVTTLQQRQAKLKWLKEEQTKLKFDAGRQESLKNAADLKNRIKDTKKELNEALKEQKRLEMIHTVCLRNLAKNEEWINCLEREIKNCGDMITYLTNKIHLFYAIANQREMDQKTREELFKERDKAITEFVKAMQDKASAFGESPNHENDSSIEKNRSHSPGVEELENEFGNKNENSDSPGRRMQTKNAIMSMKRQDGDVNSQLMEKTAALKMIASIAGVEDYTKTAEIVKFFKQTEELRRIKNEMENKLLDLKTVAEEQKKILFVFFHIEEQKRNIKRRKLIREGHGKSKIMQIN